MDVYNKSKIKLKVEGALGILTLHNPPLNLLSNTVKQELENMLISLKSNHFLRVIIITGSNRAFCAGADLKEFSKRVQDNSAGYIWDQGHRTSDLARELPQILIASLDGIAFGGGLGLALACDIIFASKEVDIGLPEIKKGVIPGDGGIELLMDRIGYPKALEMMVTGKSVNAIEAFKMGIIDYVIDDEPVLDAAKNLANKILDNPGVAVKALKNTLMNYKMYSKTRGREIGKEHFITLHQTQDCFEGINAFFEKRKPNFVNK